MKTYYLRTQTGEIRPITIKAFICQKLGTDLFSVKGLKVILEHIVLVMVQGFVMMLSGG